MKQLMTSHPIPFAGCLGLILLFAGCKNSQPDYTPFADGMKAIGICLVVCAVVGALSDLVKGESKTDRETDQKTDGGDQ